MQSSTVAAKRKHVLVLSFADGTMLRAEGRVVWGWHLDREGNEAVYGMEFTDVSETNRAALATAFETSSFGSMHL